MVRAKLNFISIFFGRVSFSGLQKLRCNETALPVFACFISQGAFATLCDFNEPDGQPSRVRVLLAYGIPSFHQ